MGQRILLRTHVLMIRMEEVIGTPHAPKFTAKNSYIEKVFVRHTQVFALVSWKMLMVFQQTHQKKKKNVELFIRFWALTEMHAHMYAQLTGMYQVTFSYQS